MVKKLQKKVYKGSKDPAAVGEVRAPPNALARSAFGHVQPHPYHFPLFFQGAGPPPLCSLEKERKKKLTYEMNLFPFHVSFQVALGQWQGICKAQFSW